MGVEKVEYVSLGKGVKYRKTELMSDGRIAIHYTVRSADEFKPEPLVGGSEVYQKDNGTDYWYCKLKDGCEFMCVYFGDLCSNDILYDVDGKERVFYTDNQEEFKENVLEAVANKPKEGYRWIPVFEVSGNIEFVEGKKVYCGWLAKEAEEACKAYSPKNGSQIATTTTYFLLSLRWLKDGIASIWQMADDSTEIGHYVGSPNAKNTFEKTGTRQFGGLDGFVGNTCKIVKDSKSSKGFARMGGRYNVSGRTCPMGKKESDYDPDDTNSTGYVVPLMELTK